MKISLFLAGAVIATTGLLFPRGVQAQTPTPPATVFPVNEPETFRYSDPQGLGSITFTDLGLDPATGFDILRVALSANGVSYMGSGITTPIPGASRPLTNLVSFTVVGPNGAGYFYQGKMGLGVEYQGEGSFHPVANPSQSTNWGLLFVPGTHPASTLSLSVDRGAGSSYPTGASMVITYSASTNDTLTLRVQRGDGTRTLFANKHVSGGKSYTLSTVVKVSGPCTLTLSDSAGNQMACSFTGVSHH